MIGRATLCGAVEFSLWLRPHLVSSARLSLALPVRLKQ
jgi:hypothetical protein